MAQQVCDSHFEPLQLLDNRQYFKWQDELTFRKDKKKYANFEANFCRYN